MPAIKTLCRCCTRELLFLEDTQMLECIACGMINSRPVPTGPSEDTLQRAAQQREACDFTNAERSYLTILTDFPQSHEALWGLVLCRYGVEYVEDTKSGKSLPTCHFAQRKPLQEDPDFLLACENAPEEIRARYKADAAYIDAILANVRNAAETCPKYDIFICYKATSPENPGVFTKDFNRARDLYYKLGQMGYEVFFAHDTLQKVAGANYEAMIYHALSTAKVMLVICSRKDYLHAPWVRSEWSRYIERADEDATRHLVPLLYDDLSPSNLPTTFINRNLEGLRMEELAALDNLRSTLDVYIPRKQAKDDKHADENVQLLGVQMALEDGRWEDAQSLLSSLVVTLPNSASVHLCQLLLSLKLHKEKNLATCTEPFENTKFWERALSFATPKERAAYEGYLAESQRLRKKIKDDARLRDGLADQNIAAVFEGDKVILRSGCCDEYVTEVVIPEGVTTIGDRAFADCGQLEIVALPESLTTIGAEAFQNCCSLRTIRLPGGVTAIGPRAFADCSELQEIVLPESISVIGESTFENCESLRKADIPDGVTTIGDRAFAGCGSLESAGLPGSLTSIGTAAFMNCYLLQAAAIPAGVSVIPANAFRCCTSMTELTLSEGLTALGEHAFAECEQLRFLDLPRSLSKLSPGVFEGCFNLIGVVIPKAIKAIPPQAFKRCSQLQCLDLPDGMISIADEAFAMCVSLAEVELPLGVNVAKDAFSTHVTPLKLTRR